MRQASLAEHDGAYSLDFCEDVLSGKYGFICQYYRKTNADTVWSAVYDVKNLKIYRVEGNPSRKPFKADAARQAMIHGWQNYFSVAATAQAASRKSAAGCGTILL